MDVRMYIYTGRYRQYDMGSIEDYQESVGGAVFFGGGKITGVGERFLAKSIDLLIDLW